MIRFTTTNLTVTVPLDISDARIIASIAQGAVRVHKDIESASYDQGKTTIIIPMTQEETGAFAVGTARIMMNWIYPTGQRGGSAIGEVLIEDNLLNRVVRYDESN